MRHYYKYFRLFLAALILSSTMFLGQPQKASADISVSMNTMAVYLVVGNDVPQQLKNKADYICDGTNDDVEMQAAINAFPVGKQWIGGVKFVGTFTVSSTLSVPSNTYLDFTQAKIIRNSTSYITLVKNQNWLVSSGDSNITIVGGIWDGDRTTYTIGVYNWYDAGLINLRYVDNSQIKDAIGVNSKDYAFVLFSSTNSEIMNTNLTYSKGFAIVGGDSNRIIGVDAENDTYGVFIGDGAINTVVSDSKFINNTGNIFFENTLQKVSIQRNILTLTGNYTASRQQVYWDTTANDVSFIGNTFYADNITGGSPYLLNIDTATSPQILVQGNLFTWSGVGNSPLGILTVPGTRIDSNIFRNVGTAIKWGDGSYITNNNFSISNSTVTAGVIYTVTTITDGLISGNTFTGGNTSATSYIRMLYNASNVPITSNLFLGTSSGVNRVMAIDSGASGTGNITLSGNLFQNCSYAVYLEGGLTTGNWNVVANQLLNTTLTDGISLANYTVSRNIGYITEAGGSSVGTGAQQSIPHGLSYTPNKNQIGVWSDNSTAIAYQSANPDATNIYVTDNVVGSAWHWSTLR